MNKIHPKPIVGQAKTLFFAVLISIILFFIREYISSIFLPLLIIVWALATLQTIFLWVAARFISLDIGENDLLFRKGILNVKSNLVPYKKITDAKYTQSIFERIFSVGTLEIDTAGSETVAIHIPSVPSKDLERIISTVREKRGDEPHEE